MREIASSLIVESFFIIKIRSFVCGFGGIKCWAWIEGWLHISLEDYLYFIFCIMKEEAFFYGKTFIVHFGVRY